MNKHIEDLLDQALKEYEDLEIKYEKILKENEDYKRRIDLALHNLDTNFRAISVCCGFSDLPYKHVESLREQLEGKYGTLD